MFEVLVSLLMLKNVLRLVNVGFIKMISKRKIVILIPLNMWSILNGLNSQLKHCFQSQ